MEEFNSKLKIEDFLQETEFCDIHDSDIVRVANEYKRKYVNKKDIAKNLFIFVRDNIKYHVGLWGRKSSEVLRSGYGMCTSSTNLLVALLRAVDIPAGYCIYRVIGGNSFGHILPIMIKNRLYHKSSVHIVTFVYLDNKWIKCDPSTDYELSEKTKHISKITDLIEWDGEFDAVHLMDDDHIISISEPLSNIDFQMKKKPRYIVKQHIFHLGNRYIYFLRNYATKYNSHLELQSAFKKWLRKNHYIRYYRYKFIYYVYEIFHISKKKYSKFENKLFKKWSKTIKKRIL